MSRSSPPAQGDVRMRGFAHRHTVGAAVAWIDAQVKPLGSERVTLREAAGRVLAESVSSTVDVPGFDRATMDGYAVVADSIDGAGPYSPVSLTVVGESLPGRPFGAVVTAGSAVRIMTGAPLPHGCDAVVPAEFAEEETPGKGAVATVAIQSSMPRGKNVGARGEDITRGTVVLDAGRLLRPQDLGALSSIGVGEVLVSRRPSVHLVITGNELLPAGSQPRGVHIADANGPMLAALAERDGAIVQSAGIVGDDRHAILRALHAEADVVVVSGGSSVGAEDHAPLLLAEHGELAIHGIAMRPSAPTGMGRLGRRLVFLLPGNPVSSLCAYDFFAGRAIRALGGRPNAWPYRLMRGVLVRKISSQIGRVDYARVTVAHGRITPLAIGGASILTSTTRADGFVVVDEDSEGFPAGAEIDVWLYA